jgi:hypothetical protein
MVATLGLSVDLIIFARVVTCNKATIWFALLTCEFPGDFQMCNYKTLAT